MRARPVLATGGAVAGDLARPAVAIRTRSDRDFSLHCGFAAGSFGGATGTGIVHRRCKYDALRCAPPLAVALLDATPAGGGKATPPADAPSAAWQTVAESNGNVDMTRKTDIGTS